MTDELVGKPIGFLYSKGGAQRRMNNAKRPLRNVDHIDWNNPSAEDIAAGLSQEQCDALIEARPDNTHGRNRVPLDKPVPGWREPLIILRGYGKRPILTALGLKVRAALLAQADRSAERQDGETRLGPKDESNIA